MELLTNHQDRLVDDNGNKSRIIVSDTNSDLIAMWKKIKNDPSTVINFYETEWKNRNTLNGELKPDDNSQEMVDHRNKHYYALRDKYNKNLLSGNEEQGMLLMCLLAFNFNGLVRYSKKGFNAACMPIVPGMHPDNKKKIIIRCNELVNKYNVQFENASYDSLYIHNLCKMF